MKDLAEKLRGEYMKKFERLDKQQQEQALAELAKIFSQEQQLLQETLSQLPVQQD